MNKLNLITSAFLLLATSNALAAQVRCENIWKSSAQIAAEKKELKKLPEYVLNPNALDKRKLEKNGFSLNTNKELVDNKTKEVLGKIHTLDTEYLFQWADRDFHNEVIKEGIHDSWMQEILEEKPQQAGRGFYVALDSLSSHAYGDSISVFKLQKPLVVLINDFAPDAQHPAHNLKGVQRLAQLGIDAVSYFDYPKEWLGTISARSLQQPIKDEMEQYKIATDYLAMLRIDVDKSEYLFANASNIREAKMKILMNMKSSDFVDNKISLLLAEMDSAQLYSYLMNNSSAIQRLKKLAPAKEKESIEKLAKSIAEVTK